jgi:hypothetical protein
LRKAGSSTVNHRFAKYLAALGALLLSLLSLGYNYGSDPNLPQILPFVAQIDNPALFPTDVFVKTFSSFPSVYPYLIAYAGQWMPLAWIHFIGYLALKFWLLLLVYELSQTLFHDEQAALLSCFLVALSPLAALWTLMGEDPIMKTSLYHTSFAGPFVLFSLLSFLRGRHVRAFLIAGLLYFVNALMANFLAVLLFAASTLDADRNKYLKAWAIFFAAFAAFALWHLSHKNQFGPANADFVRLLKIWYAGHYFPSAWSAGKWTGIFVYFGFFAVFVAAQWRQLAARDVLVRFGFAFAAMWSIAVVFSEIVPVRQIIVLQFFRSDSIFAVFGLLFASAYISNLLNRKTYAGIALSGLILTAFFEVAAPLFQWYILIFILFASYADQRLAKAMAVLLGAIVLYYMDAVPSVFTKSAMCLICVLMYLFSENLLLRFPLFSARRGLVLSLALAVIPGWPVIAYRVSEKSLEFADAKMQDWTDLRLWAKASTPESAVFFVPLDECGFRVFSDRSAVVEWLDGSAMHWAPGFETEWIRRVGDIVTAGGELSKSPGQPAIDGYYRITEEGFIALGKEYQAGYVITRPDSKLKFLRLYSNPHFAVYELP